VNNVHELKYAGKKNTLKLTRSLRNIPFDHYRLEKDGSKWKAKARDRQALANWLTTFGDSDGTRIFPSIPTMMRHFGWSHGKVCYLLADLRELKLLESTGLRSKCRGTSVRRMNIAAFILGRVQDTRQEPHIEDPAQSKLDSSPSNSDAPPSNVTLDGTDTKSTRNSHKHRAGKQPEAADARHRTFFDLAYRAFQWKHGISPSWNGKDHKNLKILLMSNRALRIEEFSRRLMFYLSSTQEFVHSQGDSLAFFCSRFDSFIDGPLLEGTLRKDGHAHNFSQTDEAAESFRQRFDGMAPKTGPNTFN
jgi:hypothetical protein